MHAHAETDPAPCHSDDTGTEHKESTHGLKRKVAEQCRIPTKPTYSSVKVQEEAWFSLAHYELIRLLVHGRAPPEMIKGEHLG